ncbi:beta-propeller domain-containing protein [Clostridium cellulovorans]|uniref:Beta propeller domain n=1 Tax=Clostridium cellulovorans (strain ATCC 35296 / DSM 3052 / OCM 3 / 743B) TaxID=573061 RepID=D9SWQ1_CLOC7|nr:beta-propeller domain-containing protein [Clostridium cellulovorans]ADL53333.1 Beta propeller domain [Clostridium cellulovorans 743B]
MIDEKNLKNSFEDVEIPKELDFAIEKGIRKAKRSKKTNRVSLLAASLAVVVGTSFIIKNQVSLSHKDFVSNDITITSVSDFEELPKINDFDNLEAILKQYSSSSRYGGVVSKSTEIATGGTADMLTGNMQDTGKSENVTTNNQVQGVEEGDIVQTDGEYIYYGKNSYENNSSIAKVIITKTNSAGKLEKTKEIVFSDSGHSSIMNLFIKGDKLIVEGYQIEAGDSSIVKIYNIRDKNNITLEQAYNIDGNFVRERMIGDKLYFITSKYPYPVYGLPSTEQEKAKENILPKITCEDTTGKKVTTEISLEDICYLPGMNPSAFVTISTIDMAKGTINNYTMLGDTSNIYSSMENLYLIGQSYENIDGKEMATTKDIMIPTNPETTIYKFKYTEDGVAFVAKNSVSGYVLNQFSMDEYDNTFRIATTNFQNDIKDQDNNIYILDDKLQLKGKLEHLAKGEKIYSVRFQEDKGYMVTFKNTDPLFVIDLSDATLPKILGELKIPGFSSYLHPYDENHLIGLGNDTKEIEGNDEFVKRSGIKLSLYDVSDKQNPKEMYKEIIGSEYIYSEALNNHKAFFFNKENNLVGFPVTDYSYNNNNKGFYIFKVDINSGIQNLSYIKLDSSSEYWYEGDRIFALKDKLYAVTNNNIQSYDIKTINKLDELRY